MTAIARLAAWATVVPLPKVDFLVSCNSSRSLQIAE